MKGLSPVIAVVLMVAVAVAAAVLAFIWAMGIQTATQAKTRERADAIINNQATIDIVNVSYTSSAVTSVDVRNLGSTDLTGTWYIYVDGTSCYESQTEETAPAGEVTTFTDGTNDSDTDSCAFASGVSTHHIKVVGPNGAVAETYVTP